MTRGRKFETSLTPEQIDSTIGAFKVSPESAQRNGLAAEQIEAAQAGIRQLVMDCTLMSVKYNDLVSQTKRDARLALDPAEVERDRAALERLFADEYRFVDPFGVVGTKQSTIENIQMGKIRREGFGKEGFETQADTLEVYGNTAISKGTFAMRGSVGVRFTESGAVRRRDISGVYHTTHTYIFRDERWQLAASHVTKDPSNIGAADVKRFTHGPPEEEKAPGL